MGDEFDLIDPQIPLPIDFDLLLRLDVEEQVGILNDALPNASLVEDDVASDQFALLDLLVFEGDFFGHKLYDWRLELLRCIIKIIQRYSSLLE